MATHKACCIVDHGPSPHFTIQSLPLPTPGPNDLLIRLNVTSVCGTDYALSTGHLGPTRSILGHEGVGVISALGSNVPSLSTSLRPGLRVAVSWIRDACGACPFCLSPTGQGETRCEELHHSGRKHDGTFAQYTIVPYRYLTLIPSRLDAVPDEHVAPILCGGVTAYTAIKSCSLVPGSWLAISGAGGGVGALGVQYAKAMGYRVIAVDAGEEKGRYCAEMGAEHYIDAGEDKVELGPAVKKLTNGVGCGAVIVTAGVGAAYQAAFDMLAPFGTYMCVGIPPPPQTVSFHPLQFIDNGYKVAGSAVGTRTDIIEALEFVKRGVVTPRIEWAKLEEMDSIMKWVAEGKIQGKYVMKLD